MAWDSRGEELSFDLNTTCTILATALTHTGEHEDHEVAEMAVDFKRRLRRLLDERSVVHKALDSVPIKAIVEGVQFEESSLRYVVSFRADREGAESESIRTERLDFDPTVEDMVSSFQVGQRVVVHKHVETMSDGSGRKVRVASLITPDLEGR